MGIFPLTSGSGPASSLCQVTVDASTLAAFALFMSVPVEMIEGLARAIAKVPWVLVMELSP